MTYEAIWAWVKNTYDLQAYFSAESLLFDVRNQFAKDGRYFPEDAEKVIIYNFQFRDQYVQMQKLEDERKQIAEVIGGGAVYESLSDEILDEMNKPEIMGVDISEYATTKETIIPPDIVKFAEREGFFGRLTKRFARFFGRK